MIHFGFLIGPCEIVRYVVRILWLPFRRLSIQSYVNKATNQVIKCMISCIALDTIGYFHTTAICDVFSVTLKLICVCPCCKRQLRGKNQEMVCSAILNSAAISNPSAKRGQYGKTQIALGMTYSYMGLSQACGAHD